MHSDMIGRLDYVKEYVTLRRQKKGKEDTPIPGSLTDENSFRMAAPGKHTDPLPGPARNLVIDQDLKNMGWSQVIKIIRTL